MAKNTTIFERLHNLRIAYDTEIADKQLRFTRELATADDKINEINKFDYSVSYTKRYGKLLSAMESAYSAICAIEDQTHGLAFKTKDYVAAVAPLVIPKGQVEDVFASVAKETDETLQKLGGSMPFEAYKPHLEKFCQLLATMRYIDKNSAKLLKDSGLPEKERQADLDKAYAKRKAIEDEQAQTLALTALNCYNELVELKSDMQYASTHTKSDMLGSGNFEFNDQFRYLLGFWKEKLPADDVKFAKSVMGLHQSDLNVNTIYLEPTKGKKNVIVKAHGKDFDSQLYKDVLLNVYFSIASRLPKNALQFFYISCDSDLQYYFKELKNTIDSKLGVKKDVKEGVYIYRDGAVEDSYKIKDALKAFADDAAMINLKTKQIGNVYKYNAVAVKDPQPLRIVYFDNYTPALANDKEIHRMVQQLLAGEHANNSGYIVVLGQNVDVPVVDEKSRYTTEQLAPVSFDDKVINSSVVIDITDPKHIMVDGREAELDIRIPGFDEFGYWEQLNDYYTRKEEFSITTMFDQLDREVRRNNESLLLKGDFSVPLGLNGQEIFEWKFDLNQANHVFVAGGSGAGKTSFLHTFILSTAYKYSPNEVQFYLADGKGSEFATYKSNGKNKVVPHIRYLQDKNTPTDFLTFLQMVIRKMEERNAEFTKVGCRDIISYNKEMAKKGKPLMPYMIAIADEYQSALEDSNSSVLNRPMDKWVALAEKILKLARSAGITLMLCAQSKDENISMANVYHFALLGGKGTDKLIKDVLYGGDKENECSARIKENDDYLKVSQEGRLLIGRNSDRQPKQLRAAYAGKDDALLKVIDRVASKHKDPMPPMILGGNEELFNVDEKSEPPYSSMYEAEVASGVEYDPFDIFASSNRDTSAFPLYLGVSTTEAYPTKLAFSTDKVASGYVVYSQMKVRNYRVLNSIMLSFLYKTGAMKCSYDSARVTYFGTPDAYRFDIGQLISMESFLGQHVNYVDTTMDMSRCFEQITELNALRQSREKQRKSANSFAPLMVVLHDLEWLKRDDLAKSVREVNEQLAKAPTKERTASSSGGASEDEIRAKMEEIRQQFILQGMPEIMLSEGMLRSNAMAELTKKTQVEVDVKDVEIKEYSTDDIYTALRELFEEGNRVNIFVVVASEILNDLKKFHSDVLSREMGTSFKLVVYGTYNEMSNHLDKESDDGDEPDTVCYVCPGEVKTRLYNYHPGKNPVWWADLKKYLS